MNLTDLRAVFDLSPNQVQKKKISMIAPSLDVSFLNCLELNKYGAYIAGGCALRWYQDLPVGNHDIDVWFTSSESLEEMKASLFSQIKFKHCNIIFQSDNADTIELELDDITYRVQLIKKYYNTIDELLERFDISVCKVATDGNSWILGKDFAQDLRHRRLRVTAHHPKILRRVMKYWTYGFEPMDYTLHTIIESADTEWDFQQKETEDYDNAF